MWGVLVLLFSSAWGLEGHFLYQGNQQTLSTVRKETVYTASSIGRNRLQELKNEGYSCAAKLQFVQCTLNLEPESVKSTHLPTVREVVFGALISLNTQYSGESLVQYEAMQNITINGEKFTKATYYEFKDFVKVSVGEVSQGPYYSFVITKNAILAIEQTHKTESKWAYKTHWIESTLEQKK
jgi:hypothetical protein